MSRAFPGSSDWYNSSERSAKLRSERQSYEKEMKGTYAQKEKDKRKNIKLDSVLKNKNALTLQGARSKSSLVERALINKNSLDTQTLANKPKLAQVNSRSEYLRGLGREANLDADSKEVSLQYADRRARKDVNLPLDYGASSGGGKASMKEVNSFIGSDFDIDEVLNGGSKKRRKELLQLDRERTLQNDLDAMDINF